MASKPSAMRRRAGNAPACAGGSSPGSAGYEAARSGGLIAAPNAIWSLGADFQEVEDNLAAAGLAGRQLNASIVLLKAAGGDWRNAPDRQSDGSPWDCPGGYGIPGLRDGPGS